MNLNCNTFYLTYLTLIARKARVHFQWMGLPRINQVFTLGGLTKRRGSCSSRSGLKGRTQPIYIGQAGYNTSATLYDRVKDSHIDGKKNGDVSRSTFRKTISALLLEPLNLRLEGSNKLSSDDNRRVSKWIKNHLRVTIVPWNNRNSLNSIEHAVLKKLDPTLNLRGRPRLLFGD